MARSQVLGLPRMISLDLTLTEEEARALMGMMQNPLADIPPDEEPEVDKSVRHAIFDPLHAHFYGIRRVGESTLEAEDFRYPSKGKRVATSDDDDYS